MRLLILIGLVAISTAFYVEHDTDKVDTYAFEGLINETFEGVRKNLPEPMRVDNLTISLPEGALNGSIALHDLSISGLKGFKITHLQVSLLGMLLNFTVNFPSINLNTDYNADVLLGELIPLYGKGRMNINFKNLQIVGSGKTQIFPKLNVANLTVQLATGSATFDLHGLLNDENFSLIVSSILNNTIGRFINDYQRFITNLLSPIVEKIINGVLAGGNSTTHDYQS